MNYFIFLLLSGGYLFLTLRLSRGLWYWWDEWTILRSQDSSLLGLLEGHFGNFFPLGRLVFFIESQAFGNFYPGLVLVNALLVIVTCFAVWRIVTHVFKPNNRWIPLIAAFGLITYATASGVVFDVLWGFQVAWLLSIFFAVIGPYFVIIHGMKKQYSLALLLFSWLSFNSNFLPAVFLYLSLMFLGNQKPLPWRWRTNFMLFGLAAMVLTAIGLILARMNPSVEPLAQASGVGLPSSFAELWAAVSEAAAGSLLWLFTPISVILGSRPNMLQEFGPLLAASPRLILLLILIVVATSLAIVGVRQPKRLLPVLALALPLITVMGLISLRGQGDFDTSFNLRYAPSVLLPATLFWVVLVSLRPESKSILSRLIAASIVALLTVTAALSAYSLISQNPNYLTVFGRDSQAVQVDLLRDCETEGLGGLEEAPFQSFTPADFCSLFTRLQ